MAYSFFDHTGEIGVRLEGSTLERLFADAALAFTDTITDVSTVAAISPHCVEIASPTLDALMIDWLDELVYRFEVRNLLVAEADVHVREAASGWSLEGVLRGDTFEALRHPIKVLVKGVTYHQLDIRRTPKGWETTVIFDI